MKFEWDEAKSASNIEKHGVDFKIACRIFEGRLLTMEDTRRDYGERRMNSIGEVAGVLVLVVTHTDRNGVIRIISARRANRRERSNYEKTIR